MREGTLFSLPLFIAAMLAHCALSVPAVGQNPDPLSYPSATPTPYPPLTAPSNISSTHTLPAVSGQTLWVGQGQSIQSAVYFSSPGDRIILDADTFVESVVLTHTLAIESAPGRRALWRGKPP